MTNDVSDNALPEGRDAADEQRRLYMTGCRIGRRSPGPCDPISICRLSIARVVVAAILGYLLIASAACSPSVGNLQIISKADARVRISPDFRTVLYKPSAESGAIIVLSDVPQARLVSGELEQGQILIIHMFLRPRAGSTPIEQTATNATFRHVILAGDDVVGVYGGGGFLYPTNKAGSDRFTGDVFEATLQLIESSPNFSDQLKTVEITGAIGAPRNDDAVSEIATRLNTEVSRRLGRVYFVMPH